MSLSKKKAAKKSAAKKPQPAKPALKQLEIDRNKLAAEGKIAPVKPASKVKIKKVKPFKVKANLWKLGKKKKKPTFTQDAPSKPFSDKAKEFDIPQTLDVVRVKRGRPKKDKSTIAAISKENSFAIAREMEEKFIAGNDSAQVKDTPFSQEDNSKPEFVIKSPESFMPKESLDKTLVDIANLSESEEAAPLGNDYAPVKESRPYILKIKNKSMELIRGFQINNIKQAIKQGKEYDERVDVEYGLNGYSYGAFLQHFVTHPTRFAKVRYQAFHGYEKYRQKQLSECPLTIYNTDPNGDSSKKDIVLYLALNQFQNTAVEQRVDFEFTDLSWDMRLDLYPEAEVTIYLFPSLIRNTWTNQLQPLSEPTIGGVQKIRLFGSKTEDELRKRVKELESALTVLTAKTVSEEAPAKPADAAFPASDNAPDTTK